VPAEAPGLFYKAGRYLIPSIWVSGCIFQLNQSS